MEVHRSVQHAVQHGSVRGADEFPHAGAAVEEWVFAGWEPDGSSGFISGHRLLGRIAWYWAAFVELDQPLLHVTEWEVPVRADPLIVKAEQLWAEHTCDSPLEQWSIGNETYATSLNDPSDALGLGYGVPTPIGFDLEWYATGPASEIDHGYEQVGVVHGDVAMIGRPNHTFTESPGKRWHRWGTGSTLLAPLPLPEAIAHTGLRAAFGFPDGSVSDLVLLSTGWGSRSPRN